MRHLTLQDRITIQSKLNQGGKNSRSIDVYKRQVLDDQELRRHHHRRQKQPEPEFLALEFQNGKGEGRQHRDHNRQQRGDRRDDAGVDAVSYTHLDVYKRQVYFLW